MNDNNVIYEINGDEIQYYDPNDPEIIPVPAPEPHYNPHPHPHPHNDPHNSNNYPNSTSSFVMNGMLGLNIFFVTTIIISFGLYIVRCIDLHRENTRIIRQNGRSIPINVNSLNTLLLCNELPDESCSVCLEDFKEGDTIKKLNCNHIFHKDCLEPWLNENNNCPMCRQNII